MIVAFWVSQAHLALGLHRADGLLETEQVDRVEQELEETVPHSAAPVDEQADEGARNHESAEESQSVVRVEEGEVDRDEAEADLGDERLLRRETAQHAVEEKVVVEVRRQHQPLVLEVLDPAVDDLESLVDLLRNVGTAHRRLLGFLEEDLDQESERRGVQHDALRSVDRDLADRRQVQVDHVCEEALDEGQVVRHVRPVQVLLLDVAAESRLLLVRELQPLEDEVALELRGLNQPRLPGLLADDLVQQLPVLLVARHVLQHAEKVRFPTAED